VLRFWTCGRWITASQALLAMASLGGRVNRSTREWLAETLACAPSPRRSALWKRSGRDDRGKEQVSLTEYLGDKQQNVSK